MIDKISKHFELNEKDIKTLSKENLVELSKSLEIVFYRGRFRMKPEDATKDNLINKISLVLIRLYFCFALEIFSCKLKKLNFSFYFLVKRPY